MCDVIKTNNLKLASIDFKIHQIILNFLKCRSFYLFLKVFKNENKGIVLKARWFVRPDINTGATII